MKLSARIPQSLAVVVIGRNEGARLTRCLASVAAMNNPFANLETIYVDSNSSDDSVQRAQDAGVRVIVLPPGRTTAARGRNTGWREAQSAFVLFLDGDTVLHPEFVHRAMEYLEDPRTAVVWGHRRELAPRASVFNRVLDLDWIYPPGPSQFCGGDALIRRDVLEQIGGYDENLIAGEEPEMCQRMIQQGYLILHIDCPMTGHDLAMTSVRQYWRRALRAGFAYASVSQRFRNTDSPLWREDSKRNLVRGSALLLGPVLAIIASLYLRAWIPVMAAVFGFLLLIAYTAARISWKKADWGTSVLYGVHSHLQQIPIFFGQLKYLVRRNRERSLIEYKGTER